MELFANTFVLDKRHEISLYLGGFYHFSPSIEPFLKMTKETSSTSSSTARKGAPLPAVEFESTLRYVNIPVPPFPQVDINSHFIPARVEVKLVLDWLRDSKRVPGIYELRIRDSLYLPHKEEVISQCLGEFDVEVLDWMRVDMSIKPLLDTYGLLKKLTLYVST
ncbi:hypothetical protein B0T10DRAFT_467712 [Thelonectria olida]|uniref:Uncharacterized protein n=1 Tax=Thelonectria olida TaxID=1576542 RepID=A0A9P8VQF5_9HYPO|nr:hypothetical protein B0T10DRAFT_467712 [Thelonectria olida]